MNVKESLLADMLEHYTDGYYPEDYKRFIRWAIEAQKDGDPFPLSLFQGMRMSEPSLRRYEEAYRVVGYMLDVLAEGR